MINGEKLIDYLKYALDPKEEEEITANLIQMKLDEDKKKEWAAKLDQKYGYRRKKLLNRKETIQKSLLIAASLLLITFAYLLINDQKTNTESPQAMAGQLIDQLNILQDPSIIRKGIEQVDSLREIAMLAYSRSDFEHVIQTYTALSNMGNTTENDGLYLGVSYLKTGDYSAAITVFKQMEEADIAAEEVDWCLALAYLANSETTLAKSYLEKIVKKRQYQSNNAEELLQKLE